MVNIALDRLRGVLSNYYNTNVRCPLEPILHRACNSSSIIKLIIVVLFSVKYACNAWDERHVTFGLTTRFGVCFNVRLPCLDSPDITYMCML